VLSAHAPKGSVFGRLPPSYKFISFTADVEGALGFDALKAKIILTLAQVSQIW
jgi:hypothetical protein